MRKTWTQLATGSVITLTLSGCLGIDPAWPGTDVLPNKQAKMPDQIDSMIGQLEDVQSQISILQTDLNQQNHHQAALAPPSNARV